MMPPRHYANDPGKQPSKLEAAMLKFTIRDMLLVTAIVGVTAAWGVDHRKAELRAKELESENLQWKTAAIVLREQFNGMKVDGKWLFRWRAEIHRDCVDFPKRMAEGESLVTTAAKIEIRREWAELR